MMRKINIAIDGPSAAGKGTIADIVSKRLGYIHLDTGAMYRCVGLAALQAGVPLKDEKLVSMVLDTLTIDQTAEGHSILNGLDVSDMIRTEEVSLAASDVSTLPDVRKKLVAMQQKIAARKGYVLEGRDIGTVVLPDAECKIFLTASVEERARRRFKQNQEKGIDFTSLDEIRKEIEQRDYQDTHREQSPLKKADDAVEIDTSHLTIAEAADKVYAQALAAGSEVLHD